MEVTAVFCKIPEGYLGFVGELPGAYTQAATLDEARRSLRAAVVLVSKAIGRWLGNWLYNNAEDCSTVRPACRIIERSVP